MTRITFDNVKRHACGRWLDLLEAFGIERQYLSRKNKPCPACGGRDRFSFLDEDCGRFVCRHHERQGGDGFELLAHVYGWNSTEVLHKVADWLGMTGDSFTAPPPLPPRPKPATREKDKLQSLLTIWREAHTSDFSALYLNSRGLTLPPPKAWRHHPSIAYWHQGKRLGVFDCLIANVQNLKGEIIGQHRTYLDHQGHKLSLAHKGEPLPSKKLYNRYSGSTRGGAIVLYPLPPPKPDTAQRLAVAEGIETALAVRQLLLAQGVDVPIWATMSAGGMEAMSLPPLDALYIYADNDKRGITAANRLADKAILAGVPQVKRPIVPPIDGDWLDALNQQETTE